MNREYYFDRLYPCQDKVLEIIGNLETGFYLSGGTASSRGYLHHRFSDENKVTAIIDRQEPKDMADIWGFCCKMGLSLSSAISDAHSKAAGIFPADIARVLCSVTKADWEAVRWIEPPPVETYLKDLQNLGDSLIILGC